MTEPEISDLALIGDTRTAALSTAAGSIDWMCAPRFDSEPIFGKLVGGRNSGSFSVTVDDVVETRRGYRGNTAVLETEIRAREGTGTLVEGMVVEVVGDLLPQTVLVRRLSCTDGLLSARVVFDPKQGLPGKPPRAGRRAGSLICEWGSLAVTLQTFPEIPVTPGVECAVEVPAGSELTLVMIVADRSPAILLGPDRVRTLLQDMEDWWQTWVS